MPDPDITFDFATFIADRKWRAVEEKILANMKKREDDESYRYRELIRAQAMGPNLEIAEKSAAPAASSSSFTMSSRFSA